MFEQPKHKLRQTNIPVQANPKKNLTKKIKFSKSSGKKKKLKIDTERLQILNIR